MSSNSVALPKVVSSVDATTPVNSSGGATPVISVPRATTSTDGYLASADFTTFNNKVPSSRSITVSSPISGSGTLASDLTITLSQATNSTDGYLSSTDWNTFNNKAATASPALTGVPTAPTAGVGTSTTQLATTAFVMSQGFLGATGSMPSAQQTSTSVVTSATTTYVTAMSTTITVTASSAPVYAKATATLTTTTAVTVAKCRVSINGVAGQEQLVSLTALATNYLATAQYISTPLAPGTYNVLLEIARNSGTGTVSFFEGTLDAIALQGTSSNGITQLTGDVTTAAGSGSQAATIPSATITGTKIASATITGANIAAATITNSLISTVDTSKITTGTLAFARGGTGATSFASQRIPFSNGTNLLGDASFIYDTTNNRFYVGAGGGNGRVNGTVSSGSDIAGNFYSLGTNNAFQVQNQSANNIAMVNAGGANGAIINAEFSRGTLTARTQSLANDVVFTLNSQGHTGSGFATGFSSAIQLVLSENTTSTTQGGEIMLATTPNGSTTPIERLRIRNSGETVFQKAVATAQYTTSAKNSLTPASGWVVYDTTLNQLSYYNGTTWINL